MYSGLKKQEDFKVARAIVKKKYGSVDGPFAARANSCGIFAYNVVLF